MKFNFDKEVLIKHHYWLVAVGALVISLAAIFLLRTSVRGAIVSEKEKLDKSLATIKTASEKPVRSKDSINQKKTQAEESKGLEVVVWKKNYMKQEPYVRWAPEVEDTYHFTRDPQTGVIGYFASQVNILEDAAPAAEDPPASDGDVFKGKVKDRDESKVTVEGKVRRPLPAATGKDEEKKDPGFEDVNETRTFFDTPLNKVEIGGKRTVFAKLREGQRVSVTYYRGRYFQDPLQLHERTKFSENYYTQFNRILSRVDPMYIDEDGKLKGVVQLRDGAGFWSYKKVSEDEMPPPTGKFIRYVDKAMWNPVQDFSELAWIAQEDVWIMDEMYRVVDQANAYVREFVPAKEATPVHWIGDNAYWRAEIKRVDADNIHVTLHNQLSRRQSLGVRLLVWFKDAPEPREFLITGDAARAAKGGGAASSFSPKENFPISDDGTEYKEIVKVEQKLTWDLAAVKRIDDIVIGSDGAGAIAHSHRTYPLGLRPYREEKVVKKEGEDPAKGPNPFGAPKIAIEKGGKDRYLEVSEQVRRLPVAVSLIVDQQHVDRVQASFANSHFRFLTTQVLLNRYPYSVSPQLNKVDAGKGPALPMGGFPMGVRPVPVPVPMFPMGGMAPVSPMAPADAGGGGSRTSDDLETNMELVIYGIITLYERYPPRKIEAPPPA